jgi:hypothetical protein
LVKIGYDGQGVGFMWGVLSQAAIGFGTIEIFFRGAFIGFVMSRMQNQLNKNMDSKVTIICYIYLTLFMFIAFRNTTGTFFNFMTYGVGVYLISLWLLKILVSQIPPGLKS